jgi:hypothetical protein
LDLWLPRAVYLFHRVRYQGIADTIVQLIHSGSLGVITLRRPIRREERRRLTRDPSSYSSEGRQRHA